VIHDGGYWFTIEKMPFRSAWISFLLAFTALLPLINPIGSALVLLGLVGDEPSAVYRNLARKITIASIVFLIVIEFLGSLILSFFGISLPVVQVTGGAVIVATAWSLLFEKDAGANARNKNMEIGPNGSDGDGGEDDDLDGKIFYPFTFPITAGPGTLVVMLTLSARVPTKDLPQMVAGHAGIVLAALVVCGSVYFCYAYAPRLVKAVSPSTVHGILRVIAFILMCIGVQIAWNGISMLGKSLTNPH
jgi:multiple antibiotic resistance protein